MIKASLDCSDLDNYLGKPMQPGRLREPLSNTDIRRWAQAMHYPNRLHYDNDFAAASRFGRLIAPQSFPVATDDGHGTAPSCIGRIPDSHMIFGGDEWWFHGPRIVAGDSIRNERVPLDYVEMLISMAGRVAKAFIAETEGVYRPSWSIDDVANEIDAIRSPGNTWEKTWAFPATSGYLDHLTRSFEMAKRGQQ